MLQLKTRGHVLLSLLIVASVLLFGGFFAIGFFLYNEPWASIEAETEYFNSRRPENYTTEESSWLRSSCADIVDSPCANRGPDEILPLVIISLDGFAANYMHLNTTPALHKLMHCGAHAKSLRPSFPSITFPNHYSIATGLHLESHGIVDNKFFDPLLGRSFHYKDGDAGPNADPVWWKGEPLWVTAKKQGKKVSTYYWPGNEVLIRGFRADEWYRYDHNDTFDNRLDRIVDRLSRPAKTRPDLIMMYYDEPDKGGHIYGVNAPQVRDAIRLVDASIGRFMQLLYDRNLTQCVNLVVLSDHGMEDAHCNKSVDLMAMLNHTERSGRKQGRHPDHITDEDFILRGHTEGGIDSRSANVTLDTLYNALSCKAAVLPNSTISALPFLLYKKADTPRRLHYTNSARIEPLILNVKPGFTVFQTADPQNFCFGGRHGYDPLLQSMESIFIAHGPAFESGAVMESISNVELYEFFCEVAGLKPAPNNGTTGAFHVVMRDPAALPEPKGAVVTWPPDLPKTPLAVIQRQNQYCIQACSEITGRVVGADMLLMLADHEEEKLLDRHTNPYGSPEAVNSSDVFTLVNSFCARGFNQKTKLPHWAAFYVDSVMLEAANFFDRNVTCARSDIRLNTSTTLSCQDYEPDLYSETEVVPTYLVPPDLGETRTRKTEGTLITNVVPMYRGFREGVWKSFWQMIGRWSNSSSSHSFYHRLHIQLGPVFDHNLPYGLPDDGDYRMVQHLRHEGIPLPSHFFVTVSRTFKTDTPPGNPFSTPYDAVAFLLPHQSKKIHGCQTDYEYFLDHSATVKDVETITGLRFFTELPVYDSIRLRLRQHTELWM